ncbi:response regulator transcription factor [Arenibaculum pallidiluteum]|uniref:response regulator transcription factor n=1 Tax=Arenibaculum pallidiluteum TaxID=2812559 RepID=UPI002E2A1A56|nr:response regulator transcription factor [Arenibaculum pallidiluteum]
MLIDPNKLFREGLKALFREGGFEIVAEVARLNDAAGLHGMIEIGMVLCDPLGSPLGVGETVIELRRLFPDARVVMLMPTQDPQPMVAAIQAGVDGCLLKDISPEALQESLRLVRMGETVFPSHLAAMLVAGRFNAEPTVRRNGLSPREAEILRHLVEGESNKVIANRIGITEATVKVHLKSLLRKIGASNRTQAAIWAHNNGLAEEMPKAALG